MFPQIVEHNGKFYVRQWIFGWYYYDVDGYWWKRDTKWKTAFDTKEDAEKAYENSKVKFVKSL